MNEVCSKPITWIFVLMLIVPATVLTAEDPPATQNQTARDAQPVATTPVPPTLHRALASSLSEAASFGAKVIPTPSTGTWGIVSAGEGGGGIFRDSDSEAEAWLGTNGYGVEGFGATAGGYFEDSDSSSYSYVGYGSYGIQAFGPFAGGYFGDTNGSGVAWLGGGDVGVQGEGSYAGGYFADSDLESLTYVAIGDRGIQALGTEMGGYFKDWDHSGYAHVGSINRGIEAYGTEMGGYFKDSDESGYAWVGFGNYGILAFGNAAGGDFYDINSSSSARVGHNTYKINGTGTVSFVQNHPYDPSSVIVYAAPEGDEVATYTRGTARLVDGEATVPLGETFKWVTNPDIGLTAHLTPREDCNGVYLADLSTQEIVVRELQNGTSDCGFDFLVYGLRIGFEELSIVQEKTQESYIPSMADHRQLYERRPDLKTYNSLERFKGMHQAIDPKARLDLSRAQALRDAIIEFDPAVHELPRPPGFEEMHADDHALDEGQMVGVQTHERVRPARGDQDRRLAPGHSAVSATIPMDDEGNVYATSFRPSSQDLASLVDVSEEVNPGDVLVIDRDNPGMMRKAFEAHDTGVIGVVALDAGVVAGTQLPATEVIEEGVAPSHRAAVGLAGVVTCNVDAAYGAVWPGDFLVTSPTPGHAMRADLPLPGTTLGKALEPLQEGVGTIKVFVMLR